MLLMNGFLMYMIFTCIVTNAHPYNILFLKGSQIKNEVYTPFLQQLQNHVPLQPYISTVKVGEYFLTSPPEPSTIVIGHSFGGYFGLLQAMKHSEQIKACILINSHFNHRAKMPYLPLSMYKVKQPTLLMLNQQDEKLPLSNAMDDYFVYRYLSYPNYPTTRKEFQIRPGTHFSTFTDPQQSQKTVEDITEFIRTLSPSTEQPPRLASASYYPQKLEGKALRDKLDTLCQWKLPNTRMYYHLPTFLSSKPGTFHCLYHPGNLFKTRNFKESELEEEITREIRSLFPTTPTSQLPDIYFKKTYLPVGMQYSHVQYLRNGLFPYSLTQWLAREPRLEYFTTPSPHWVVELLVVPILDNILYYKLPNKLQFLETFPVFPSSSSLSSNLSPLYTLEHLKWDKN